MSFIYRVFICLWLLLLVSVPVHADYKLSPLQQGQESLANGNYRDAEQQFFQAEQQANAQNNADARILVHALQGYMALLRQQNREAGQLLTAALTQAKQSANPDLIARIDLYLGQLYDNRQNLQKARYYFQQAVLTPEKIIDKTLLVSGYYQLAKLAIDSHQPQIAWQQLQQAVLLMQALPVNSTHSQLWLNIGYQTLQLYTLTPQDNFSAAAFSHLNHALTLAAENQQPRIQTSALKHLANLYQQQQKIDEAIKLLQEAILLAEKEDASDLLIDLHWKIGQLYQHQHKPDLAITAYRQAVNHIDRIRIDIPVSYRNGRSSFRDTFAPIYLALADLLLQQSSKVSVAQQQSLLAEARDSIERMKKSELEDYFQSRCDISAIPLNLQKIDPHAAAFYPILLPDRLEIIVYTVDGLRRFTSPVSAKELERQARLFADNLRNYADFSQSKAQAQRLHRWLIAPVQAFLQQQHIETLIYIPDGVLRLVPLAALYDGKQFVIEQYAVATSAGMSMINSTGIEHEHRMLLAGISVPGEVVSDLPDALLTDLVIDASEKKRTKIAANDDLQTKEPSDDTRELSASDQQKNRELRELLKNPTVVKNLQKLLSLPGVDIEIKQLAEQNHSNYLLNESFSLENFTHQLKEEPHDILHIASHGFFGSTAEDSFIMTYDKILNLNQLEVLLSSDYFKQFPIDLLVLSACQTAEGDDRSPLGISGVAIKTKVRSALGSLWPVSDEATAQLMVNFYSSLNTLHQTKAKALQTAMLKLVKQKDFANPSFWSPFILIGSWI
jgi:CHAT domain-containing protein